LSLEHLSRLNRTNVESIRDGSLDENRMRGISMTELTIELPEEIERELRAAWENLPRRALEALAVEGYRSGVLTRGQVGHLLDLNFWETETFLKEKAAFLKYTLEDLEQDRLIQQRLRPT
jgi:predicted HTH domain antitoxin